MVRDQINFSDKSRDVEKSSIKKSRLLLVFACVLFLLQIAIYNLHSGCANQILSQRIVFTICSEITVNLVR